MNSIDSEDKKEKLFKYIKYLIFIILIIIIVLIVNSCNRNYSDIEKDMITATKNYISSKNIVINQETYISITELGEIEGTELCSKASGVIVSNTNRKMNYQPYLSCPDYKSDIIKNKSKYVVLNGDEVILLNENEVFDDPMYYLKKALLDGDVTVEGKAEAKQGIYNIYYKVYIDYELKETLTRKIIVTSNDKNSNVSGLKDTEEPTLTLLGDKNMILAVGSKYEESGYLAVDYKDGKITRQVKVLGEVDTSKAGNYQITYSVTNSRGKTTIAFRKIDVVALKASLDITATVDGNENSNKNLINFRIIGEGYNYTLLPNGRKEYSDSFTYEVNDNRTYTFKVYDIYNNQILKDIEINNIDNIAPIGSCQAVVSSNKTSISVVASDNRGISGYSYILDGVETSYQPSKIYEVNKKHNNLKVNIKDIAGNVSKISCAIEEGNEEYINEKGYNCLQPFSCFKQGDYSSSNYQFCSTDTCGPINKRGCSITSVTTIISGFGVRDATGELYTPYTLLTNVYNKICSRYCSGSTVAKKAFEYVGLKVVDEKDYALNKGTAEILKNHLRNGGAALLRVDKGWYTNAGHLMAILGINEEGLVYLYDPGTKIGTSNGSHDVNTYVPVEDIIKGGGTGIWFQLVTK